MTWTPMSSLLDVGDNAHANTNGSGIVSGSASRRPKDVSTLDLGLMQRVPSALSHRDHRRGGSVGTGTPLTAMSEASTTASSPTTPHGHPLRHAGHLLSLPHGPAPTPVPIVSIMPLCLARIAEGLIFAVIFPYINQMMHDFGVPEEQVGIWSATAESILMVTESLAAPMYAPLADRYGRRTVLIPILVMWGVSALSFGFVWSPGSAVFLRAALGTLAGAGVITRTMCGELCDKSNRIQGFALFSPAFTIGVTIAPLIGGFLSRPVPRLLSPSWTLFVNWPYLLPSAVVGLCGILGAWAAYKWLPETLPPRLRGGGGQAREAEKASEAGGIATLLKYKKFQNVLILYGLNNAVMFSWEAIFPLFAFTSANLGGLGLTTQQIGVVLAASAGLSIAMTIWIFPIAHKSMSEGNMLRVCLFMYPLAVILFPVLWALSQQRQASVLPIPACTVLGLQMLIRRTGDFAGTLLDTIVLDAIPGPEYLAMANSVTFSMAAVGRAIGPFIVSGFFSFATTSTSALSPRRQLVWLVFMLVCTPSIYFGERVVFDIVGPEAHAKGEWDEEHELLTPLSEDRPFHNDD